MPFVSKRKNKSLTRFRANLRGAFQRSATKSIILRCSDGSRALFAGNESLSNIHSSTHARACSAHLHLPPPPQTTWPPWREPRASPRSTPSSSTASPPRRSYCASPHPPLVSSPLMPEPRDFAASKAAAARVSPRAARRIDGARRGKRFVFGFRAGSLRLRPRPFPSRRVTHGAVHRPPWHAFVARDALSENIIKTSKTRLFAMVYSFI